MADPTIQTFCCQHGNRTVMSVAIVEQFNTSAYNLVSIFSSTIGILGSIYQVSLRYWIKFKKVKVLILFNKHRYCHGISFPAIIDGYRIRLKGVEK